MKTAICFTGTARSLQYTHENIKKNLISSIGECDIFSYIAQNPHSHKIEKYLNIPQVKDLRVEKEPEHDISKYSFRNQWPPPTSSPQIYIKMVESRKKCRDMVFDYEKRENIKYDRIFFSRLDVVYYTSVGPIVEDLDLRKIYIPDFHNTFGGAISGFNDRFALSCRENMYFYMDVLSDVETYMNHGHKIHAETLLKWHLEENKKIEVEKIPIRFSRIRPNGEEIDARLREADTIRGRDA